METHAICRQISENKQNEMQRLLDTGSYFVNPTNITMVKYPIHSAKYVIQQHVFALYVDMFKHFDGQIDAMVTHNLSFLQ